MTEAALPAPPVETNPAKAEGERLFVALGVASQELVQKYRKSISHTGSSLLVSSMVYAYSKALNDAAKLINEKRVKDGETHVQA